MTKQCRKCWVVKPLDEFYAHPAMKDGRLGKCKECACRDNRENRKKKLKYYRQYDLARATLPKRRATLNKVQLQRRASHPEKTRAHNMVHRAIKKGLLVRQPCEKCGAAPAAAHHDDYSKPLDVRWLCKICHRVEHGAYEVA